MWKERIIVSFQVAFTYIGTIVGAGFASGQETLQFFTLFGTSSIWAITICTLLFSMIGIHVMRLGYHLDASSYQELNFYVFGKRWGEWVNAFIGFSLFMITSAMMSGIGSLFKEQLGISFHFGVFCAVVISLVTMYRGMDGLISVNSVVVPLMLAFMILIFCNSIERLHFDHVFNTPAVHQGSWLVSTCCYVAFNVVLSQAVLAPLGAKVRDESSIYLGGWLGGIGLGVMLMVCNVVFLQNLDMVSQFEIPMAYVVASMGVWIKYFFLCVVAGEIITTLVGNVYGLAQTLEEVFSYHRVFIVSVIFLAGYICSMIGFSRLVGHCYPFLGYCGIFLVLCMVLKRIPYQ